MRQKIVKWTALLLAVVMTVQLTAGCSNQANSGTSEDESPVTAESVAFNETGEYTTQLTSSAVDLSDVQKEDVSVTYETLDEDAYQQAVEQAEQDYEQKIEAMVAAVAVTATEVPELEPVWITDYVQEKQVEVLDVQAKKGQLELTFSDPEAAENRTSFYTIHLNGKQYQNADVVAELGVKFKEYALSANIDSVLSNAEETRLTLELNDGAFAETMTQADITLSGSFEQMEIESMSCAGRNLTLQLVGKPEKPEGLTTYVDGVVTVRPQAVVDAGCPLNVYIPIELVGKSFDASTLKMENGTVTAELELVGKK